MSYSKPPVANMFCLQVDDEHGFIRYFKSLPTTHEDTIRIFDRGDWYTAHGEDATFIAKTVCLPVYPFQATPVRTQLTNGATFPGIQDDISDSTAWPR